MGPTKSGTGFREMPLTAPNFNKINGIPGQESLILWKQTCSDMFDTIPIRR